MSSRLQHEVIAPAALDEPLKAELYALFSRCYDCVSRRQFDRDLSEKDSLILLRSVDGCVRGFSTQQVFDWVLEGETVRVMFSGDTIIEPACWGSPELMKGWCEVAAKALHQQPRKRLFWLLISKGYRTYLFLPLFFQRYLPGLVNTAPPEWGRLLDEVARNKFGNAYDEWTRLVRFPSSHGQLTGELAEIPPGRRGDAHVRFFMAQNPDFAKGVELACLTEVSLENTHGLGRRWLGQALELQPQSARA